MFLLKSGSMTHRIPRGRTAVVLLSALLGTVSLIPLSSVAFAAGLSLRGRSVPQHLITIRHKLAIAKFDVTRDEYGSPPSGSAWPDHSRVQA
jgi:hypothetical protein